MTSIATTTNDHHAAVLTAPDGSTTFRASSIPTALQIADWCHPRGDPDRWIRDSVAIPVAGVARELPIDLLGIWAHPDDEASLSAGLMDRREMHDNFEVGMTGHQLMAPPALIGSVAS